MTKISFNNLKLKTDTSVKTFKVNEQEIEVLQYLPIQDKYDLVMITLQNCQEEDHIYNPIKLEMYFNLFLIFMYTNINFTDKQKEDLYKLYDVLESNGIIDNVIDLIPDEEYKEISEYLEDIIAEKNNVRNNIATMISNFFSDLPRKAEEIENILNNFDPEQFQNVLDFAKSANGGRDIR